MIWFKTNVLTLRD